MSRLTPFQTGYGGASGFECQGWTAPVYPPMDGEGCVGSPIPPLNRYLNFPSALVGETPSAPNHQEFYNMKPDIEASYDVDMEDFDPFNGTYVNLADIAANNGLSDRFHHDCFPLDQCDPPQHHPGHLLPPVPFIINTPVKPAADPGIEELQTIENLTLYLDEDDGLCLRYNTVTYKREPGSSTLTQTSSTENKICVDTTTC